MSADDTGSGHQLRLFIERIERLQEEAKGMRDDIRDVFLEMKAMGFDTKAVRRLLAERRMKKDDLNELNALLETYRAALGMS